jgi:hypothetical protein
MDLTLPVAGFMAVAVAVIVLLVVAELCVLFGPSQAVPAVSHQTAHTFLDEDGKLIEFPEHTRGLHRLV